MESVKRIFNNTVVVFVLAILAVASIVAAAFINIDANTKQSRINNTESTNETVAGSSTITATESNIQSGDNVKELQNQELNSLLSELEAITNRNSSITDIVDKYIAVRYNYTNGPDKEKILSELNNITRKFFLGQVDNSLNFLKGDSKAEIIKRYAATDSAYLPLSSDAGLGTFVYIVNINGANKVMEYTVFNESGRWVIYDEKEIGTVEDKDIETKELLTPDIVKAVETSTESGDISSQPTQMKEVTENVQ